MMKKLIALVLALVLCLGLVACGDSTADSVSPADIDFPAAFAKHDPNEVVLTVNGEDVTWSEFYYMMFSAVSQLMYYMGEAEWDTVIPDSGDKSFSEFAMELTMDSILQFHAINKQAEKDGLEITDKDKELIEENVENFILQSLGEEATTEEFEAYLLENFFVTMDVYRFINVNSVLYDKLFEHYIGMNGEKLTEEDVTAFVEKAPYITAKHILVKTIDAEGNPVSDEDKAEAKARAERILDTLQGIDNQKKLISTFDDMLLQYNEDEGQTLFTGGYTFTKGQMYPVFEEAAFALEEYEISGIVESQAGYHIIMRLPTTRDSEVDYDYQYGTMYTIETYAATDKYSVLIKQWMDAAEVVWKSEFEGITAEEVFA